MVTTTYTTKEMAEKLGVDQKLLRRFFRSAGSGVTPVGQGNRYNMGAGDFQKVRRAFSKWQTAHTRPRATAA